MKLRLFLCLIALFMLWATADGAEWVADEVFTGNATPSIIYRLEPALAIPSGALSATVEVPAITPTLNIEPSTVHLYPADATFTWFCQDQVFSVTQSTVSEHTNAWYIFATEATP